MYKTIEIKRERTGEFRKALIGSAKGKIGAVVKHWNWGGVDLEFDDGYIITYANDDVESALKPVVLNYPPAGFDAPFGQWYDVPNRQVEAETK